jgi:hypothetical protein
MTSKEDLIRVMKSWVKIDNEIRLLQKELNARKSEKKESSLQLIEIMKTYEIDCFEITDGTVMYKKQNIKKPLTKKSLYELTRRYLGDDKMEEASQFTQFLLENRETVMRENLVLKPQG